MFFQSIDLYNFRNYQALQMEFDPGVNLFYGNNAQGKTNLLEALYFSTTTKSYRSCKDKDMIRFGETEAHIRSKIEKKNKNFIIDFHLKAAEKKGIAINQVPIRRASELFGLCNMVFFSPEDLSIIKQGPAMRRRFLDMEIGQADAFYLKSLAAYKKVLNQRNALLKDSAHTRDFEILLSILDEKLVEYGSSVILIREKFIKELNQIIRSIHFDMTKGNEEIVIQYEADVYAKNFTAKLKENAERDIRMKTSEVGPHRDDLSFSVNGIDLRYFGSQGQQRTAALSLKLAEIELLKQMKQDKPVLLLDDVLSELDRERQRNLLDSISDIQTFITCTGMEDFIRKQFDVNRVYHVEHGRIQSEA